MYKGKNPSALRSQRWIEAALLELIKIKDYDKITIKEIALLCDLSRQTFYKVFDSKEEIIEYHLDKLFTDFLDQVKLLNIQSIKDLSKLYFEFYNHNSDFINLLFNNHLSGLLVKRFKTYLPIVRENLGEVKYSKLDIYREAFISSGLVGILEQYSNDMDLNIDDISYMLEEMIVL